ncbi:MAG: PilZ domain-containing protein [Polyangiaceae bacterium]|nr:PilZ domain-containing protein [Polyangiaceae bacterium]MCW5789947.1 PilZ domain-containing protein [Polyangiaceae bacterium]
MNEKRKHPRTPCALPVSWSAEGAAQHGVAKDIGPGGMFVASEARPKFGTELTLTLRLPGLADESALPAVVRWLGADGFGVMFGPLGARDTHAITEMFG